MPILKSPLSSAGISFEPALPVIHEAASQIGFGSVIKIVIEFTHAFWETGEVRKAKNLFFVLSEETVPTWWSHVPDKTPVLSGWLAGPNANKLADACDETIFARCAAITL